MDVIELWNGLLGVGRMGSVRGRVWLDEDDAKVLFHGREMIFH